ncbi:Serine/threonine-protein kinase RAD53 [Cytospora mali]|uniref:Autophagy-related protein 1 n=1 Tax=Cytospora mali TaxID=578113 RepID=A0A194UQW7_CYTMA|nr:Serine/threonine-protein kinase RAD53 [Valsa mali var. pyri (nom. inval.)]
METEGFGTPTQEATQTVLDPRRLGEQNSGFADDDIADIICLLLPYSPAARTELRDMALRTSQHIVDVENAAQTELRGADGDNFELRQFGEHAIILRLSAQAKDPVKGFTFGRNFMRCDVCFQNDPMRRLSNIHFRIHFNDHEILMLEDCSINGTVVDGTLLKGRPGKPGDEKLSNQRTITSGSLIKVLMVEDRDDLAFIVKIPHREGIYEEVYRHNLTRYMDYINQLRAENDTVDSAKTITPGPGGHVDLFPVNETKRTNPRAKPRFQLQGIPTRDIASGINVPTQEADYTTERAPGRISREWTGSDKYNRVERIGKGAFATVYKVTHKFHGMPYAAKELDKRKFMKNGVLDLKIENEMNIMQRVKHPNIVEYIEHIDWGDRLLIIIMEYVPHGDLGTLIADNGPIREYIVQEMASQMLSALAYLHANNITHRDVKPDNILCQSFEPFCVKLTDFGLSKMIETEQTFLKTFCGTLLYCAPEVYNEFSEYDEYGHRHPRNRQRRRRLGQRYDHAIDIWSLGGVLYYALSKSPPFPAETGISYTELLHRIMTKALNTSPLNEMNISEDGINFLSRMLQPRPEQRATIAELRSHTWLAGTPFSQGSNENDIDEGLQMVASQLSIQDKISPEQIPASDEDEFWDNTEQTGDDEDGNAQSQTYESQKENYTFGPLVQQPPKLYGEVGVSAVGSSGVIPSTRLNLINSAASLDETEIIQTEIKDSFGSEDSTPRQVRISQATPQGVIPLALTQSRDRSASRSVSELNNMTFDPESQDLGGAESQLENLNMKSLAPSNGQSFFSSFNTSKRKPTYDTSDEFDSTPRAKPPTKKLRSDSLDNDAMSYDEDSEQGLFAQIPPLSRVNSSRQIDKPVHKSTYWDPRDQRSWHLKYPEMTQLQHDAFASAAKSRGEKFAPGQSRLWDLAMKHFPPADGRTPSPELGSSASDLNLGSPGRRSCASSEQSVNLGITGRVAKMVGVMPSDNNTIVPAPIDIPLNRVVASLESTGGSVVSGISIPINQAMISWGRAPENTHTYTQRMDTQVPKHTFKVILWKNGYEPSKNFRPWNNPAHDFHFYISTKATHGIRVNKMLLPSDGTKDPKSPSKNWARLHDGDTIAFWRSTYSDDAMEGKLIFRCSWGGSSRPRDDPVELVSPEVAACLDASCSKAEERIKKLAEYDQRLQEADEDASERQENIARERLRSYEFETRRLEACRLMAMRGVSRRNSPAVTLPPISSAPPAMMSGAITRHMSVPTLRHATSGTDARTLQSMMAEE